MLHGLFINFHNALLAAFEFLMGGSL